jgi:ubiquinone/menaquinone biosynthesis C-methylase UbiE
MRDSEIREAVRKSWDLSSTRYDSCPGHGIGTVGEKAAWKQELFRDLPQLTQKVLDAGCGTGVIGLLFSEIGHEVNGVDLSERMLLTARGKANEQNLSFEPWKADAEHLPFHDRSFDVVVTRHLLWTLPHPGPALEEWHRVLKEGGRLLIIDGVWDDGSLSVRVKRFLSNGLSKISGDTHGGHYDNNLRAQLPYGGGVPGEALVTEVEQAGFTGISCRDIMHIRDMQKLQQPWYRRFAQGRTYYLLTAIK